MVVPRYLISYCEGGGKAGSRSKPRPSLVTVDINKLGDILSQCLVQSAAVKEAADGPDVPPRFILTRAAKKLAGSSAAPSLPLDASLISPAKSAPVFLTPKRDSPPHRPAAQLRVFAEQVTPAATNPFAVLASAPDTVLTTEARYPDVTEDACADQAGSGAL
ncbi:hypothetical protein C8R44DRAFT_887699 [Mycena epipterygia]|nr:hypothetical protein C8R44DRAFT_887699 [Mycena epipterygia]